MLPDIPLKSYSENFLENSQEKTPLKMSCFNNHGDSRPKTLLKRNLTVLKQVTYGAYVLKIFSLAGTPHSRKF